LRYGDKETETGGKTKQNGNRITRVKIELIKRFDMKKKE
jgi:hypothetical protein